VVRGRKRAASTEVPFEAGMATKWAVKQERWTRT